MKAELAVFRGHDAMAWNEGKTAKMSNEEHHTNATFEKFRLCRRARAPAEWAVILEMLDEKDTDGKCPPSALVVLSLSARTSPSWRWK